jgi:hypothetical protein
MAFLLELKEEEKDGQEGIPSQLCAAIPAVCACVTTAEQYGRFRRITLDNRERDLLSTD